MATTKNASSTKHRARRPAKRTPAQHTHIKKHAERYAKNSDPQNDDAGLAALLAAMSGPEGGGIDGDPFGLGGDDDDVTGSDGADDGGPF